LRHTLSRGLPLSGFAEYFALICIGSGAIDRRHEEKLFFPHIFSPIHLLLILLLISGDKRKILAGGKTAVFLFRDVVRAAGGQTRGKETS
jgi:hypothetical protein